jgi:hypothetical protein
VTFHFNPDLDSVSAPTSSTASGHPHALHQTVTEGPNMASTPRRQVLLRLLCRLAAQEGVTPLELVCRRLESGKTFVNIAAELGDHLGANWNGPRSGPWTPSRAFVSLIAHRLEPDAPARIADARRKAQSRISSTP